MLGHPVSKGSLPWEMSTTTVTTASPPYSFLVTDTGCLAQASRVQGGLPLPRDVTKVRSQKTKVTIHVEYRKRAFPRPWERSASASGAISAMGSAARPNPNGHSRSSWARPPRNPIPSREWRRPPRHPGHLQTGANDRMHECRWQGVSPLRHGVPCSGIPCPRGACPCHLQTAANDRMHEPRWQGVSPLRYRVPE